MHASRRLLDGHATWQLPPHSHPTSHARLPLQHYCVLQASSRDRPRSSAPSRARSRHHFPLQSAAVEQALPSFESTPYVADPSLSYSENLNLEWAIPDMVEFGDGENGLPVVVLRHPQSECIVQIYLHGAAITNWVLPDGTDALHCPEEATFDPDAPIQAGLTLSFPQHREGALPEDGFASRLPWDVVGTGIENFDVLKKMHTLIHEGPKALAEGVASTSYPDGNVQQDGTGQQDELETSERPDASDVDPQAVAEAHAAAAAGDLSPLTGVDGDLAPFVMLRLTDGKSTSKLWPHKFELDYKITLMAEDDFAEVRPGEDEPAFVAGTLPSVGPQVKVESAEGETVMTEQDEGEVVDADTEPVQLKLEFWLRNLDAAGSDPMRFQLGTLARFATDDQLQRGQFIKVLGLGGQQLLDYTDDKRFAKLGWMPEDFLHFAGQPIDTTFVNAKECTVLFCPGNRTHFELLPRHGFKDVLAYHPGLDPRDTEVTARYMAGLGAGQVASTKRLLAGEEWHAEYVLRFHNRYWKKPIFGEGLPPMPPVPQGQDDDPEPVEVVERDDGN